jgi:hypothetical protein
MLSKVQQFLYSDKFKVSNIDEITIRIKIQSGWSRVAYEYKLIGRREVEDKDD